MSQPIAGLFKILIFIVLGVLFRKGGILKKEEAEGLKKVILNAAIPTVLFLSFSSLKIGLSIIPVILIVLLVDVLLFWAGVLIYRISGSKERILPISLGTMNLVLLGIPLYEAFFGYENLHHYTILGIGNEIFIWFVFLFLAQWFLSRGKRNHQAGYGWGFLKNPIIWGMISGCAFSILGIDISESGNAVVQGIYQTITGLSKIATPVILIYIGFNIHITPAHIKESIRLILIRIAVSFAIGIPLKITVMNRIFEPSGYFDAAWLLLMILPAVFSVPLLIAEHLDEEEFVSLNNTIVLHSIIAIIIFSVYTIIIGTG